MLNYLIVIWLPQQTTCLKWRFLCIKVSISPSLLSLSLPPSPHSRALSHVCEYMLSSSNDAVHIVCRLPTHLMLVQMLCFMLFHLTYQPFLTSSFITSLHQQIVQGIAQANNCCYQLMHFYGFVRGMSSTREPNPLSQVTM